MTFAFSTDAATVVSNVGTNSPALGSPQLSLTGSGMYAGASLTVRIGLQFLSSVIILFYSKHFFELVNLICLQFLAEERVTACFPGGSPCEVTKWMSASSALCKVAAGSGLHRHAVVTAGARSS